MLPPCFWDPKPSANGGCRALERCGEKVEGGTGAVWSRDLPIYLGKSAVPPRCVWQFTYLDNSYKMRTPNEQWSLGGNRSKRFHCRGSARNRQNRIKNSIRRLVGLGGPSAKPRECLFAHHLDCGDTTFRKRMSQLAVDKRVVKTDLGGVRRGISEIDT
jgi:hypothetical protein